jgi:hypothetical protein
MGYRSDVGLCLTNTGRKALEARILALEAGDEKTQHIRNLLHTAFYKMEDKETGAVAWFWESVKWYADYDDVSFIENFLQELDDNEYLFIRIGESEDDTEIRGIFWDNPFNMYLSREIIFD